MADRSVRRSVDARGGGGSGAFVTVSGIASDDVARIDALLADGQHAEVPFKDNAFLVDLPRANLPARLIAYDAQGRVISVSEPWYDFGNRSGPARGRAKSLLRVSGLDTVTAELLVAASTGGGECMYVKHFVDRHHAGVLTSCSGATWSGPALQLSSESLPPLIIGGRVRSDVRKVRIRFADGSATVLTPTQGYILWAAEGAPGRSEWSGRGRGVGLRRQRHRPPVVQAAQAMTADREITRASG